MAFDAFTINSIVKQLNENIIDAKIDRISQPEKDEILLSIRGNSKTYKLLISASSNFPRIYLVEDYKKENPLKAPNFLMLLRKHIQSGRILSIQQDKLDRVVHIDIDTFDELKNQKVRRLTIEIMGRHSNIILVDKETNKILDAIKKVPLSVSSYRQVLPQMDYKKPPEQDKYDPLESLTFEDFIKATYKKMPVFKAIYTSFAGMSPLIAKEICFRASIDAKTLSTALNPVEVERLYNSFERIVQDLKKDIYDPCIVFDEMGYTVDFSCIYLSMYEHLNIIKGQNISNLCEQYYNQRDKKDRLNQKSHDVRKVLSNKISTLEKKIQKQSQEINETIALEDYKKDADLLTAYIYMIEKGMDKIEINDFYNPENPLVTVKLDQNLSPSENVQKYYKKYNKLKSRKKELTHQIENAKSELDYLYNIELSLENISSIEDLEEIIKEMKSQKIIKGRPQTKSKKSKQSEFNPMQFSSSDGFEIYVGKNNVQNDYLTLKFAKSEDIWMHTKNIPGSHVIIKSSGKTVSDTAIKEAAQICAFFSKAKFSSSVPVDYTMKKNVKKPNGAKPGMVIYETNSTIYVTPEEQKVMSLKAQSK